MPSAYTTVALDLHASTVFSHRSISIRFRTPEPPVPHSTGSESSGRSEPCAEDAPRLRPRRCDFAGVKSWKPGATAVPGSGITDCVQDPESGNYSSVISGANYRYGFKP